MHMHMQHIEQSAPLRFLDTFCFVLFCFWNEAVAVPGLRILLVAAYIQFFPVWAGVFPNVLCEANPKHSLSM